MANYEFKCINDKGEIVKGSLEAASTEVAAELLSRRDYIVIDVHAQRSMRVWASVVSYFDRGLAVEDLIMFTKQLRTLVRTGMPIIGIMTILKDQTENKALVKILVDMTHSLNSGSSLHVAFSHHPKSFSPLYCGMVKAGEVSGSLSDVLDRLSYILEHENKIKKDIKGALRYPMIVLAFLSISFIVLLTFVIPKFAEIFINAGVTLPLPTRISIFLYQILSDYWYFVVTAALLLLVFMRSYLKTEQGRYCRDKAILACPVIGAVLVKAANSRFSSIFSILQRSGVNVIECIKILSDTIGNYAIAREFEKIAIQMEEGKGLTEPLRSAKYFTPMLVNMVAIGEKTGSLEEMLNAVSEHYDDEVEHAVKGMADAIAPLLTVGLAFVVGFFALSVFMPIWELSRVIK